MSNRNISFKRDLVMFLFLFLPILSESRLDFVVSKPNSQKIVKIYEPTWKSLDTRPIPEWFDDSKVGFFTHFGLFSVPSFSSEWFWHGVETKNPEILNFMHKNYPPNFKYQDFASLFKAEFFDADNYAAIVKTFGVKYVVFTTKHHEGYTMWNSSYSWNWNSVETGPKINFVDKLMQAFRKLDIKVMLYFSLLEWFHPLYIHDERNGFKTSNYVDNVVIPQLLELVTYYKPDGIWSDGDYSAVSGYWKSEKFLAWLYNDSPVRDFVVVNDRWGKDVWCKHGGYWNCKDRYLPNSPQPHKFENAFTIDMSSWGNRREARLEDLLTFEEVIWTIIKTVAFGGNALVNAGTSQEGTIPLIYVQILKKMGKWLSVNGESIFKTFPFRIPHNTDESIWFTTGKYDDNIYAFSNFPESRILEIENITPLEDSEIYVLGYPLPLPFAVTPTHIIVQLPESQKMAGFDVYVLKLLGFE